MINEAELTAKYLDACVTAPDLLETDLLPVEDAPIRAGFVALVGKPNVGKSTLLNALLGQKVAIVSDHPQTTRLPLRGILNLPIAQLIFIDTPGIHEPHHKLGQRMVKTAKQAIPTADLVCLMVDISKPPSKLDSEIAKIIEYSRVPHFLVLNKVDLRPKGPSNLAAYRALGHWEMEVALSAKTGAGLATLVTELAQRLPLSEERLYPEDWVTDQTMQNFAAEIVREKVLLFTSQEIPHSVAIEVEEWQQKDAALYMRMTVSVEKPTQKGIIIGAQGKMLKRIGQAAREELENIMSQAIYLDLWVKVRPNWRNDLTSLGWLGYSEAE